MSDAVVARMLGVSPEAGFPKKLRNGEAPFEVGDLLLMGKLGLDIAERVAAELRVGIARSSERTVAVSRVIAASGKLVADAGEALADGLVDDEELARIERDGCAVVDSVRGLAVTRQSTAAHGGT